MTEPVDLAQLAADLKTETAPLRDNTSEPTSFLGAPHIGLDWADPLARPAAWRAFGEDA